MLPFLGLILLAQLAVVRGYDCGPHDLVPTIAKKILSSPNYPSNYPRNIDCSYFVMSVACFTTVVEVEYFYTELTNDYLSFSMHLFADHNSFEFYRWSGMKVRGSSIRLYFNATVNFRSNNQVERRGYNLTYYSQPIPECESECEKMNRTASFVEQFILSPQYLQFYPNSFDCKYTINPQPGYQTVLKVNSFVSQGGHDTLSINSAGQRELTLSGIELPGVIYRSQGVITLHFVTDQSIPLLGYNISYYLETISTSRSTPHTTPVGHGHTTTLTALLSVQCFTSLDIPSHYPDSRYRRWVIRSRAVLYRILVRVVYFQLDEEYEMVTLTTGSRTVSWRGFVRDGTIFLGDAGKTVEVEFTSGSTVGSRAFNLSYVLLGRGSVHISSTTASTTTTLATPVEGHDDCGGIFSASPYKQLLISPFYPANYPNSVRCNYTIYSSQSDKIYLQIRDFRTEYVRDTLTISSAGEQTKVWSGTVRSGSFSSDERISIIFTTDSSVTHKGFAIYYCTSDCIATRSLALQLGVGLSVPIAFVILFSVIIGCCCCRKKRLRGQSPQSGARYPVVEGRVVFNPNQQSLSLNNATVIYPSDSSTIFSPPPSYQEFISDPDRFKVYDTPPPSYSAIVGCYPE